MFLILPPIEAKTCFLIIINNVRGETIILNVFLNIVIVCCWKIEVNNVSVLISETSPLPNVAVLSSFVRAFLC